MLEVSLIQEHLEPIQFLLNYLAAEFKKYRYLMVCGILVYVFLSSWMPLSSLTRGFNAVMAVS